MTSPPPGLANLRVLVVDDDTDARELLAFLLESCGVEVRTASSAPDALELLESTTPDVLISDIGMPGEDGYSLIQRIRAHPSEQKSALPAIALTAFAGAHDRERSLSVGFDAHMTKPVQATLLLRTVMELATQVRRPLA